MRASQEDPRLQENRASTRHPEGERFWHDLSATVRRAVVVDDAPLRLLAVALLAHGHALVEDVPGVGKTLLTRALSRALGLSFARVQGTPDLLPSDVLGASMRIPCLASTPSAVRSAMPSTSVTSSYTARGRRECGGTASSAEWRYHSAQAVASVSAR